MNFSKAYDTVCQKKPLLPMLDAGIPPIFIRFLSSFLTEHRARVQLFNIFNSSRYFTQDLSQGLTLAPLLNLFSIISPSGSKVVQ